MQRTEKQKSQALTMAIDFIKAFTRADFPEGSQGRAQYSRFCFHRKKYKDDGQLPSIKTIEQAMELKGYKIIFVKS